MTEFRIAESFTSSLGKLTAQEQKAVKMTAFDLQLNPASPGLSFHKLDRAQDKNFWSVRVNSDIRLIVHKTAASILLVYVNHHDDAYKWAERRKIERHPTTGAMQIVEIRERIQEIEIYKPTPKTDEVEDVASPVDKPKLFDNLRKFELMAFGVPEEWVNDVRKATEDSLFDIIEHLPQEAQEALLKLAVGEKPEPADAVTPEVDAFAHPDAQRRFRILANAEELERALEFPWEKWAVFLHPVQTAVVEKHFNGPARVSGSAGTGKTIVALHRAVHQAQDNPGRQVLLTTFSKALANNLRHKLGILTDQNPRLGQQISVKAMKTVGYDLYADLFGQPQLALPSQIRSLVENAAGNTPDSRFTTEFLFSEWSDVVDAWQLHDWTDYRDVTRLGRKTRLSENQRQALWSVFETVRNGLKDRNLVTWSDVFGRLTDHFAQATAPFDYIVVDEAQDLGVAEARFLAKLAAEKPDGLFFAGDLGQRIFQQPFSWNSLGISIRGRSQTLRINYRTSHQIRSQADKLLPQSVSDVDGNVENRKGTVSMFNGPDPVCVEFDTEDTEIEKVGAWISDCRSAGFAPEEIGIFVRSQSELGRARSAVKSAGLDPADITEKAGTGEGKVPVGTMHLAKGLEFRAVAVMACDDEVIPHQSRIETVTDEADLEEVYNTERHLLYVACTRARDRLHVSGVEPISEFLEDMTQD